MRVSIDALSASGSLLLLIGSFWQARDHFGKAGEAIESEIEPMMVRGLTRRGSSTLQQTRTPLEAWLDGVARVVGQLLGFVILPGETRSALEPWWGNADAFTKDARERAAQSIRRAGIWSVILTGSLCLLTAAVMQLGLDL